MMEKRGDGDRDHAGANTTAGEKSALPITKVVPVTSTKAGVWARRHDALCLLFVVCS